MSKKIKLNILRNHKTNKPITVTISDTVSENEIQSFRESARRSADQFKNMVKSYITKKAEDHKPIEIETEPSSESNTLSSGYKVCGACRGEGYHKSGYPFCRCDGDGEVEIK